MNQESKIEVPSALEKDAFDGRFGWLIEYIRQDSPRTSTLERTAKALMIVPVGAIWGLYDTATMARSVVVSANQFVTKRLRF